MKFAVILFINGTWNYKYFEIAGQLNLIKRAAWKYNTLLMNFFGGKIWKMGSYLMSNHHKSDLIAGINFSNLSQNSTTPPTQRNCACSKASPQGNRAQEQGISTAFFLRRSRRSNPRLLDQIRRLNCSCIRRFNCDIYESIANITMCKHMNFNLALAGSRQRTRTIQMTIHYTIGNSNAFFIT